MSDGMSDCFGGDVTCLHCGIEYRHFQVESRGEYTAICERCFDKKRGPPTFLLVTYSDVDPTVRSCARLQAQEQGAALVEAVGMVKMPKTAHTWALLVKACQVLDLRKIGAERAVEAEERAEYARLHAKYGG